MISSLRSRFKPFKAWSLFVTGDRAVAFRLENNRLTDGYSFALSDDGLSRFQQYLYENADDPVYIVTDLADEEFKYDTIPHVGAGDRMALVERRQARLFRNIKYSYYEIQGRDKEDRRDDRILFSSITEDESLQPWIVRLLKLKVPIAGIYSVAFLSKYLLDAISHEDGPGLVVSLERGAGLRQTFFLNRHVKFSRLVRMPHYEGATYAPIIRNEVEKMLRYLRSMRYLSNETLTKVYLIGDRVLLKELMKGYGDRPGVEFITIDLYYLSDKIGLSANFADPFAEAIYAYLVLKYRPRNIYAKPEETRYCQLRNISNAMVSSSVMLLIGSLIWGGLSFVEAVTLKQQSINTINKTKFYEKRYSLAKERLPDLPVEPRDLKAAVEITNSLESYKARPLPLIEILSSTLQHFPEIQIQSLEWLASVNPNASLGPVQSEESNSNSYNALQDSGYLYFQIAEIKGYIAPFDGNYRHAISRINQFIETVRTGNKVHNTRILAMPLDVSSESRLRGTANEVPNEALFDFRLEVGITDEN